MKNGFKGEYGGEDFEYYDEGHSLKLCPRSYVQKIPVRFSLKADFHEGIEPKKKPGGYLLSLTLV